MELLINAVDAIRLGVEDSRVGTHARYLSAVRNIHAGTLLLYKEALRRLSPPGSGDVLMKKKIVPKRDATGVVTFVGVERPTADVRQIKERFEELGIKTDWKHFDVINKARNEIEHYYTTATGKTLEGVIANTFVLVRDFISTQLADDPRNLLGDETWRTMLEVSDVYAAERAECEHLLKAIDWKSEALADGILKMSCAECGSQLLRPEPEFTSYYDVQLQCRACGGASESKAFIPQAIEAALGDDAYRSVRDGDEPPYVECSQCGAEAYVIDEKRCALCDHEAEHVCQRCCIEIPAYELDSSPFCGYCAHMMSKDD